MFFFNARNNRINNNRINDEVILNEKFKERYNLDMISKKIIILEKIKMILHHKKNNPYFVLKCLESMKRVKHVRLP